MISLFIQAWNLSEMKPKTAAHFEQNILVKCITSYAGDTGSDTIESR